MFLPYEETFRQNPQHFASLKNLDWLLGDTKVEEFYEYKNLGVLNPFCTGGGGEGSPVKMWR